MFLKMSRNNRLCFAAVAVFVVATILVENTDAATLVVGGTLGWRIPTDPAAYDTFASQNTFAVGDVLVFNFPTGQHDVAPVTKEAYDSCNASAAISLLTVGPASVTLSAAGTHYYICTFGQHCLAGQKLAVNVTASSSSPLPSPPPTAQITPSPTPLPPTSAPLPPTSAPPPQGPSPSGSTSPPSEGPSPTGSAPSEGPSPTGSAPSEGPSPSGSAPSEGPGPSGSDTPSPGSASAPGSLPGDADGSGNPPPSSGSKTSVSTIFVGMFISAAVGFMF